MKNWKLSALLNTPLGVVIMVGAVVLCTELLFMLILHNFLMVRFRLFETTWDIIDAVTLTVVVSPALYFLVFRKILEDEERFRQTLATAPNAIVIVNEQGRIIDWNHTAQKMFQYSREEAMGQQLHQLIAPPRYRDDAARGFARFEEIGTGPLVGKTTEVAALRKDGSEFPIELSISAVRLKGHWHAIGIAHDITERKRTEEALRDSEDKFRNIVERSFDAIHMLDMEGRFTYCSPGAELISGYRPDEVIGIHFKDFLFEEDIPKAYSAFNEMTSGGAVKGLVLKAKKKDGTLLFLEINGAPIFKGEKITGIQFVYRDITERKNAETTFHILVATVAQNIGAEFFRETVRSLSTWLGVECVIVGELVDGNRVRALAMQLDGKSVEHYEYPLAGTPCESATEKGYCEYHEGVVQLFPVDKDLVTIGAESYFGTPIWDKNGKVNGILCAISRHKFVPPAMTQGVFEIIAARAGTEIERLRMDEELQLTNFALNHAVDSVFFMDPSGKFRYVNETACRVLGYSKEELLSMGVADIDPSLPGGVSPEMSQATKNAGFGRVESEHRAKNGRLIPVEIIVAYLPYKGEDYHCAFVRDITERKQTEQKKLEAGILLKNALENAIGAIAATLEQRDPYTAGHQRRVAQLAAAIGEEMGLAREVIEGIHFGGLIHDIGKISVPAEILGKPGRLTDIELCLIKTHAEAGYEIVKGIAFPWPVADMVRQHHERLDGSGYPQGLKGEQIMLEARILAVADVVEAMSANRPYRPGLGIDTALDEITRARGAQLDPVAVDACLRVIKEKGFVFTK